MAKKKKKKNKKKKNASKKSLAETQEEVQAKPKKAKVEDVEQNEELAYVRGDVKKISFVMLILAVLLVGTYFLNQQTELLSNFGDWLYEIMNIKTQ